MQLTDAYATLIVGFFVIAVPLVLGGITAVRAMVAKVNRSDDKHKITDERLGKVEVRLNQGDERMNGHQKSIQQLDTQVSTQGEKLDSLQDGVKRLEHGLDRVLEILLKR